MSDATCQCRSRRLRSSALLAPFLSAGLLALGSGCSLQNQKLPDNENIRHPYFALEDSQPAEVAIVPVRDQSPQGGFPAITLRTALYDGLPTRLYTPIDLEFVDTHWAEGGFDPTTLQAGGVLQVLVQEWDKSLLISHGVILVKVTVEMLDGERPQARPLWGHTFRRRLELAGERTSMTETELYDHAAELLALDILALLPPRDPARE